MTETDAGQLTKKDFQSDQEVRWCPGCGDFSVLSSVQRLLPQLDTPREKHVFVSGIGCSSRFPYYMNTYGFHSIHGRAPGIASGIKLANPELTVWIATGDGDALSIGGNHFLHLMRRNLNLNMLLFNNKIYALTKGQYSPTSEIGKQTKSSPHGVIDPPLNPVNLALAAGATFVARGIDIDGSRLADTVAQAARHKGCSFVEVYQNCIVFNDGAHRFMSARDVRADRQLWLEHGKPLVFGEHREKCIIMDGLNTLKVASVDDEGVEGKMVVHDATDRFKAQLISCMNYPDFPVPMGVFLAVDSPTYDDALYEQIRDRQSEIASKSLTDLLAGSESWVIE